jgi:hypothetical protein
MPELNDIIDMSQHLLDTINSVYADAGIAVPDRQYYVIGGQGQTVPDCEQVTVSWDQAYSGIPANEAAVPVVCDSPHTASFIIEVVRKVNTARTAEDPMAIPNQPQTKNLPGRWAGGTLGQAEMPEPEDFMREARVQMQDAVLLLRAGLLAGESSTLGTSIVDVSAGAPSGGYQATIMNYTAAFGFDPMMMP